MRSRGYTPAIGPGKKCPHRLQTYRVWTILYKLQAIASVWNITSLYGFFNKEMYYEFLLSFFNFYFLLSCMDQRQSREVFLCLCLFPHFDFCRTPLDLFTFNLRAATLFLKVGNNIVCIKNAAHTIMYFTISCVAARSAI